MEERKVRVAITHGDTNGTGYELIFKTFAEPTMLELCTPIVYGSPKVAIYHRNALGLQANFTVIGKAEDAQDGKINMIAAYDEETKVELGTPTQDSALAAFKALKRAADDAAAHLVDALVALPVRKGVQVNGQPFEGQLSYLEKRTESTGKAFNMLLNEQLRLALATSDIPLKDIIQYITPEQLRQRIATLHGLLKRDFRLSTPRIAVLALNPKGENGAWGNEEETIIKPVIKSLEGAGIQAFGPYAADEFFANRSFEFYDAVLAMYSDQGTVPFMTLDQGEGYGFLAGLPVVCTMPIYGTATEIGGKGLADECSFRHAVFAAIDMSRNRINYDEPLKNPLPKLYHEKRDESEKVRFAIPKKHDAGDKDDKKGKARKSEEETAE